MYIMPMLIHHSARTYDRQAIFYRNYQSCGRMRIVIKIYRIRIPALKNVKHCLFWPGQETKDNDKHGLMEHEPSLCIPRISSYSDNPLLSLVGHTKRGRGRRAAGYPAPNFWLQGGGGEGSYFSLERNSFWGIPEHHTRHKQTIFYIESNQIFDLQFFSECLSTTYLGH